MAHASDDLERGRDACARSSWAEAASALARAEPLDVEDVERLALARYMLGEEEAYLGLKERAHHEYLRVGDPRRAAAAALWIGLPLASRGEMARAGGWLARAGRIVEEQCGDCAEAAYLLLPRMFGQQAAGDYAAAAETAAATVAAAQRFGDRDLFALAVFSHGHLLVLQGQIRQGLQLLSEAMVAVTAGEVSPIQSGIVYCGVILGCQDAYAPQHAREWTAALTAWCARQPDMVAFTGRCLVHRAEILQLDGAWPDALAEAQRAAERCRAGENLEAAAEAAYRRGEIHRLRGEHHEAETAFREAAMGGYEPQPGLALLRLAQGDAAAAAAALARVLGETAGAARRVRLLPAAVEVALALGDARAAGEHAAELTAIASGHESDLVAAMAGHARGLVALAGGDPGAALAALRPAWRAWHDVGAPYEAARVRIALAEACRGTGDEEAARLELEAARATFDRLGALPDRDHADRVLGNPPEPHGLTARELQVLRLVAGGGTNRAIAAELVLSERTVDRHVSNILAKLRVSSRAAATARAYEEHLL